MLVLSPHGSCYRNHSLVLHTHAAEEKNTLRTCVHRWAFFVIWERDLFGLKYYYYSRNCLQEDNIKVFLVNNLLYWGYKAVATINNDSGCLKPQVFVLGMRLGTQWEFRAGCGLCGVAFKPELRVPKDHVFVLGVKLASQWEFRADCGLCGVTLNSIVLSLKQRSSEM